MTILSLPSSLKPNFTALLVGSTAGIGKGIAINLAKTYPQANITIAGRSAEKGAEIVQLLKEAREGKEGEAGKIDFKQIDVSYMDDVKKFCKEFSAGLKSGESGKPDKELDVLVLSTGIMTTQKWTPLHPGSKIDMKLGIHYYSRMLIIRELLPVLSPNAVVMSVLDGKRSNANYKGIKWDDLGLQKPENYSSLSHVADSSCAYNDIMLQDFATTDSGKRTFIHAYPGLVNTEIGRNLPFYIRAPASFLMSGLGVSIETCGERMINGMWECRNKMDQSSEKAWNIDEKGKIVVKPEVASAESREKLRKHTWETVDSDVRA